MKTESSAVVFPGQGAQKPGMGKDFYENIAESRETYEEASRVLGWDVAALCFGDDERLNLTRYAQPCILATEISMFRGLRAVYGFSPEYFGGHSLGEYTALVAAGAMPFGDALKAVEIRGRLMQEASPPGEGAMAAVISDDLDPDAIREHLADLPIDVANINSRDQIVISGRADCMATAEQRLLQHLLAGREARFVPLNVSAPFHSRFMQTIKAAFQEILAALAARIDPQNAGRVTCNVTGGFHGPDAAGIIDRLVSQISGSVNWRANMQALAEKAGVIYEIGPNRPLRNFFKTMGIPCNSITSLSAADRVFA